MLFSYAMIRFHKISDFFCNKINFNFNIFTCMAYLYANDYVHKTCIIYFIYSLSKNFFFAYICNIIGRTPDDAKVFWRNILRGK